MRENNARHLSNVSAQIAAASDKHDKNMEELRNELRKCKEDSAQRYQDLQLQIKTLEQKCTAKVNVMEDKFKVMKKQLTEAQNTKKNLWVTGGGERLQKKDKESGKGHQKK